MYGSMPTWQVTSRVLKADELATRTEAFDSQSTSFRQPELIDAPSETKRLMDSADRDLSMEKSLPDAAFP